MLEFGDKAAENTCSLSIQEHVIVEAILDGGSIT